MAILLIRHGETALNAARIFQKPETPLSERGLEQAERLARRLAALPVARILSSDLRRAEMTAEPLQRAIGAPLELEPLLQERNFGDLRGTAYADLGGIDPFAPDYAPPRGETWEVFEARVDRAWARVRALAGETEGDLAVVTHGLVCHSLLRRHLVLPEPALHPARPHAWANTSLPVVDRAPPFTVRVLACVAHLETAHEPRAGAA